MLNQNIGFMLCDYKMCRRVVIDLKNKFPLKMNILKHDNTSEPFKHTLSPNKYICNVIIIYLKLNVAIKTNVFKL